MTDLNDPNSCIAMLVRHGATDNNVAQPPRMQGQGCDSALSQTGRRQAAATAELLAAQPIAAVYCSPLKRALQTAEIIAAPIPLRPIPVAALREVDVGRWEGRSWEEIQQQEPAAHRQFLANPAEHGYAGGENLTELCQRVQPAAEQLMRQHIGATILIVAHNVVNRVLLASLMGIPLARARELPQANCGVNVLRYRDDRAKVLTMNAMFHLPQ